MMDEHTYKKHLKQYLFGGVLALAITSYAFLVISQHGFPSGMASVTVIMILAVSQAAVQLYLFLHLGEEKKPYWKNFSLLFATVTVLIVVIGSIWIMTHLNYNMRLTPSQQNEYMLNQNKEGF